jgi:hypothetical protein
MKKRSLLICVGSAVLLLGLWSSAAAQSTITFGNASVFGGDPHDGYGGNYGVGFYTGTVTTNGTTTSAIFICDDFLHSITQGQSWSATGSNSSSIGSVRFDASQITNPDLVNAGITTQQEYNMIGYLVTQLLTAPSSQWQYISWAIWSITDGAWHANGCTSNCTETSWYQTYVQSWVMAALNNDNTTYSFTIWTPTGSKGQEFFMLPESTLLAELLLMGMFIAFTKRRVAGTRT